MEMTESQKLADTFRVKAKDGLVDVKFFVVSSEAACEQVCGEVNRLYEAVDNGDFVPLDFADRSAQ